MIRVLLLCALPLLAGQSAEQLIRAEMQRQQEAWNRGDVKSFMESYENAPSTAFVGTSITRGYQEVLERYNKRYPTRGEMGVLTFSELEVQMLGKSWASVIGRYHLKREAGAGGDARGIFTLLWKKTAKGWKMTMDHTSAVSQ